MAQTFKTIRFSIFTLLFLLVLASAQAYAGVNLVVNNDDRVDPVPAGGEVIYDIRVTNSSETGTDATGVNLTVTIPAATSLVSATGTDVSCTPVDASSLTCDFGTLPAITGEKTVTVTIQTTVQDFITLGAVATSIEGATDGDNGSLNNTDDESTTINAGANLELALSGPATAQAGEKVSYNLTATNNGPDAAGDQQISYPMPSGFNLDSSSLPSGCSESGGTVTCDISGPIANAATVSVGPISGQIVAAGVSTITHSASISVSPSAPVSDPQDPDTADNTATFDTTVSEGSDLALDKTRNVAGSVLVGDSFNYILTPTYTGNSPSTIEIIDTLPDNFTIGALAASQNGWSCGVVDQTVTCSKAAGGGAGENQALGVITIPVTVASSGSGVVNSASITADSPSDPNSSNNTDSDSINLLDPTVDLDLTKSGPNPALVVVGTPFNYNITPRNNGTTGFYGDLVITENVPTDLTITAINLNGWSCDQSPAVTGPATVICQRTYASDAKLAAGSNAPTLGITAEATAAGLISNSATISTPNCNPEVDQCNDGDLAHYDVTASIDTNSADISILKTVVGPDPVPAGDILSYQLEVVNSDLTTPSTSVVLSDTFATLINNLVGPDEGYVSHTINAGVVNPADISCSTTAPSSTSRRLTCNIASLPPCTQGSDCPTVTIEVRPGGNGGTRSNTATVVSNGTADPDHSNESATVSSTVDPRADIYPNKTATPDPVPVGQNLTYVVSVGNNGPSRAENVTATDSLPDNVTFVSATPSNGSCSTEPATGATTSSDQVICNLGTINQGAQQTVTIIVRPNLATIGTLSNSVSVTTPTIETDNSNNSTSISSTVSAPALDLVINKTDNFGGTDYDPVAVGDTMRYQIRVSNSGPSAAEGVTVTDTLPATNLSYQSVSGASCSTEPAVDSFGGTLTCELGYLPAGSSTEFTVEMLATNKGLVGNSASVASDLDLYEAVTGNNSVTEQTTVRTKADMAVLSKTPSVNPVNLRDDFDFVIQVKNEGGLPLSGLAEADDVLVSDSLPSGMELTGTPTVTLVSGNMPTSTSCTGIAGDTSFTCPLGTVTRDTIVDITVPVQLVSVTSMPQTFTNSASVSTSSLDVDGTNDSNSGTVTTNSSSISGQVFRDFNADGSVTAGDTGIAGVSMTLTGSSFDSAAVSRTVITDANGNFNFTGIPQSDGSGYTIVEGAISENYLNDGDETAGTAGGSIAVNDEISGIVLAANKTVSDYLFAEVPIARIGIAKRVSSGPTVQTDGTFLTPFQLVIENFSLEQVNTINVTDTLEGAFPGFGNYVVGPNLNNGEYTIHASPSGSCSGLIGTYTGVAPNNVIATTSLGKTSQCTINFTIKARPTIPMVVPYLNQADINGIGTLSAQTPGDISDNGSNPDPNNNNTADDTNESDKTPVNPTYSSGLTITKEILSGVSLQGDTSVVVPIRLTVENDGNEPLNTIQVRDDLAARFGTYVAGGAGATLSPGDYTINTTASGTCSGIDSGFDGNTTTEIAAFASLAIGENCSIDFTYRFMPTASTSYQNLAEVNGIGDYTTNAATDTDPIDIPYPRIGLAKQVVGGTTTNDDGTITVPFSFVVENLGGEPLSVISLTDDLSGPGTQFGAYTSAATLDAGEYNIETAPAFSGSCSGAANTSYNGDTDIALATISSLPVTNSCTVTMAVKFRPEAPLPPGGNYSNQAYVTGTGVNSALVVNDQSDDGVNPDSDNDGIADETGENDPTPVNVSFTPQIALSKRINGTETTNADGTVTAPFRVTVTNSGTEPLLNISVSDILAGGAPLFGVFDGSGDLQNGEYTIETAPTFNSACTTVSLTAGYEGDAQNELATFTRLDVLDSCEIDFTLRFKPISPLPVSGYSNQATTLGTGEFSGGDPVTDLSQNGLNPDLNGDDDPTNDNDPTPVSPSHTPAIGIAKELTAGTILSTNGGYRGTFQLVVENLGNEELLNVSISDAMNSAPSNLGAYVSGGNSATLLAGQYTIESNPTFIAACTNGAENLAFTGAADTELATISEMAIGASCTLEYGFRFVPQPGVNYFNQATASGTGAFSTTAVNDLSDDGTDPDSNGNNDANEAGENDPTPIAYPRIGLAKRVVGGTTTNDDGTITVPFSFVVENLGGETLNSVNITDDLSGMAPQFGSYSSGGASAVLSANQYTIETAPALTSCSGGTLTSNYDGQTQPSLATIGSFTSGATCTLTTTIRFRPGLPFPSGGNYENQAVVAATGASSGISITDISDDGLSPDSDGDGVGNEPGENDSTPVPVTLTPQIALNKQRTAAESINADGTVTVPFRVKVTNSGTEPLANISVIDTLAGVAPLFGVFDGSGDLQDGEYTIETAPTFNGACTTGSLSSGYEGDSQNELATFTRLDVHDSCEIDFTLRFKPTSPLPGGGYSNQATATAEGEFSSTSVTDFSQDGNDPDPDGDGDPNNNDVPTPVNPVHTASIGIAKTLQSGLLVNSNGSYSGTFRLVVENLGNEELLDVNINDAMNSAPANLGSFVAGGAGATLSAGEYSIESVPAFVGVCTNGSETVAFNGESAPQLATISELAIGTSCTLEYGFRFVPQPGTSYLNQATAAGTGAFSAVPVNDLSDDGLDPDTNGNSDATEVGENGPTPIPIPRIGVAKSVGAVVNNGDGTYDVPFVLTLVNAGETALASVQISDDLAEFGSYTVATIPAAGEYSISTAPVVVNPSNGAALVAVAAGSFTGTGAGTGLLVPASSSLPNFGSGSESTAEIHFTLRFFPTTPGPFNNSAIATGLSPAGGNVTDDSVSGNTPDADGNGDPGNDDSPTVVNLSGQVAGVAKAVGSIVQLTTKSYDIPYSLILLNPSATITATNVQLSDDLSSTFPTAASVSISSPATISDCSGTVLNIAAPSFDGTTQTQLLAGNQNLQPSEQCTIAFTARVDFGSNPLPAVLQNNSAVATTAETPGGSVIASDLSDNGIAPDPDGNGNASESGENDPTPVDFRSSNLSSVSGTVWVDSNHDRIDNDGTATNLPTFIVEVLNSAGAIVGTTTSDETGSYSVGSLFPSTTGDPSTYYDVRFRESVSGAIYGNPLSQDPSNPNGTIADGIINALRLLPGTNTVQQDLPLDPSGVIYDSVTRIPVAGATVSLSGPPGFDPALHLVGGTGNETQVTGISGFYQYILLGTAPDGDYSLTVTPPPGYVPTASSIIPVCTNTPTVGAAPDPALVQNSVDPPLAAAPLHDPATCPMASNGFAASANSTQYYTSFYLTTGTSANIINNHIPVDPVLGGAITLVKTTPLVNVSIGQLVPYTITATNNLAADLSNIDIRDTLPPGFKYKSGSASLDGISVIPAISGRVLSWPNLSFSANASRTIKLLLVVGAGVQPGEYINTAQAFNNLVPAPDNSVSNRATAAVRVIPDPVFDCSDVIGKVFDDQNANGYQDDGEPGIPNVRVATVRGLLVTTDAEGRYHVTCAMVPNEFRGSNFIMKLDERTLPSGYRITTENPRVIHLTRGKMGKLNFGAAIHRIVRLEMNGAAFIEGQSGPERELSEAIDILPQQLRTAPSIIRLAYNRQDETDKLIRSRLQEVRKRIEKLWEEQGCCYTLGFEEEIFQRNLQSQGGEK